MATQLLTKNAVLVENQVREDAQAVVEEVHDRRVTGATLVLDDGQEIVLSAHLVDAVRFVLSGLTQGDLSIRSMPDELTSTTAADLLGISRPTLMKLVADGELESHKVGSHHRFAYREVVDLGRRRRAAQRDAFAALRAFDEEHPDEE
jgi:excisionase family DNA binding protein